MIVVLCKRASAGRPLFFLDAAKRLVRRPEALAEHVYGGRHDLGNDQPGDGWRYRGAWMIGTTGRQNFRAAGARLGINLEGAPELIEQPLVGARAAGAYWEAIAGNGLADRMTGDKLADEKLFAEISKKVGRIGLTDRKVYWHRARTVLRAH